MNPQDRSTAVTVLAHEPGAGWITFATVSSDVADRAEMDALDQGFDAVAIQW